jgi:ABC-2 type transport system permease protein
MSRLARVEARLLARDWTVLVFAFVFPVFCMVVLAGVFGNQPDDGFGNVRPDDYYVVASLGVPVIALCLVGLPVSLASYRERGVLRRFEAFGVPAWRVVAAQAVVTLGLVVIGAVLVLALASFTYGIPSVVYGWQTVVGALVGVVCLLLLGIVLGLAVPSARAAQAVGLLAFFPLYLLGGGGPPRGVMTGPMGDIASALPSPILAVADPWLGSHAVSGQLVALGVWGVAALAAAAVLARRV